LSTVIKVENISKQYRLGQVGTGTIRDDLRRWWANVRGKEDPTLKIGQVNTLGNKGDSDYVWALKDINFEVKQGEVLGIIGKNGAGKSTLLKILSKVTTPSTGKIKIKGRIASLLEVGTGFHPDLSGRENIFLNGAILGMTKREIKAKFDEIVDFSGVEKYIDTPVKRYSSGMYVRLAFAVAAHLDPEILIVDEVLAVGDAEFQKKCLGKMKDVSDIDGRTILFVSHNMIAIESLCNNGIIIKNGHIESQDTIGKIINLYINSTQNSLFYQTWDLPDAPKSNFVTLLYTKIQSSNKDADIITVADSIQISCGFVVNVKAKNVNFSLLLWTVSGICLFNIGSKQFEIAENDKVEMNFTIPANYLNTERYSLECYIIENSSVDLFRKENLLIFEVNEVPRDGIWYGKAHGVVRPNFDVLVNKNENGSK